MKEEIKKQESLLVILAHPDDESFPMGGSLAKYASEGVSITLICTTSGELGIPHLAARSGNFAMHTDLFATLKEKDVHYA